MMSLMKAYIFDPTWDQLVTDELTKQLADAGIEPVITKDIAPLSECKAMFEDQEPKLLCLNPDYVGWKLPSEDYKDIPNLQAILHASTSFSWLDVSAANEKNIPICNIRNFSTQAVAEWGITMMYVARQIPRLVKDDFPLDFDKDFMKYRGMDLHGKTVGVIGLGHIGSAIAERCKGLGMNVTYWSKSSKDDAYTYVELEDLFKNSDIVFPTMALNEETKGLITNTLLDNMKPTAMFISVVHELFDEKHILDMVKDSKLFGFGYEAPPASFDKYEGNVWAAPAYGWVTEGAMHNSIVAFVQNMVDAKDGKFPHKVN